MFLQKKDNAGSLVVDNPLLEGATTVNITPGTGVKFPSTGDFMLTIWDKTNYPNDPADDSNMEKCRATARTDDAIDITRGQEGTVDTQHPYGSAIELLITANTLTELSDQDLKTTDSPTFESVLVTDSIKIRETGDTPTFYTIFSSRDQDDDIHYYLPMAQALGEGYLKNDGLGNLSWSSMSGITETYADTLYYRLDGTNSPSSGSWDFGNFNIQFGEITTPGNPPENYLKVYAKDDVGTTKLYMLDSNGIETALGGGGTGGITQIADATDVETGLAYTDHYVFQANGSKYTGDTYSHTWLDDVGTNTHATIDSHLASTSNPHSVTAAQAGAVALTGNETVAGVKTFSSIPVLPGSNPTTDNQATRKKYVDDLVSLGISWKEPVIDKDLSSPPAASDGDRYIVKTPGSGAWVGHNEDVAQYNGATWDFTDPTAGDAILTLDDNKGWTWSGSAWVQFSTTGVYTASNGLYLSSTDVRLGGTLIEPTTFAHGNFDLTHNLTGTGDFIVQKTGSDVFRIYDTAPSGGGRVLIQSQATATKGLIVKAISGQTANLQDWQTDTGVVSWNVTGAGYLNSLRTNVDVVPSTTTTPFRITQTPATLQSDVNTGTDESFDNKFEAWSFVANGDHNVRSIAVKVKRTGTLSSLSQYIRMYLYADNGGKPDVIMNLTNPTNYISYGVLCYYGELTTAYAAIQSNITATLVNGTTYWIVLWYSAAPAGGTIEIQRDTSGTNTWSESTDGLSWVNKNGTGTFYLYGRTNYSMYVTSDTNTAIYANSINTYGILASSTNGTAVYGSAPRGYGIYGASTYSYGGYFSSTYGYGIYGISTNSYGIYGRSDSGNAIYGYSSGNGFGVYGNAAGTGSAIYGSNSSSGTGVYGVSTTGIGVYGATTSGTAFQVIATPATTNVEHEMMKSYRRTSGVAAAGIGHQQTYYIENSTGVDKLSARHSIYLSNATTGTETSAFAWKTIASNGALTDRLVINGAAITATGTFSVVGTTILSTFTGLLKGTSGTVSVASGGSDYEYPLTFTLPLLRTVNVVTVKYTAPLSLNGSNELFIDENAIKDSHIDWGTGTGQVSTVDIPENVNLFYTDARVRLALSETITGISYDNITGIFSLTSGYVIPTTTEETNWNSAYSHSTSSGNPHSTSFLNLSDTPDDYTSQAGKGVRVNSGANALEFYTITADTDEKVKVSANDTTAGYLNGKLVNGTGISLTENNNGSDETLTIANTDTGSGAVSSHNLAYDHTLIATALQSVTAHNLLSTTHGDTTADSVIRGDIITGQGATPKWTRLAFPATPTGKILQATATDVEWSTYPLTIGASASVSGSNTGDQTLSSLGAQAQLNGTGFVKASGTSISYDNSTYLTAEADTLASVTGRGALTTVLAQFQNAGGIELGKDDATNVAGVLKFWSAGANDFYTTLTAGTQTANATYTLPVSMPASNKFLQSTNAGVLSWETVSANPGGTDTQVQFNDSTAFGGDSGLTYNKTTDTLNGVKSVFEVTYTCLPATDSSASEDVAGGYMYHDTVKYKIYSYKVVNGTTIFSDTETETGLVEMQNDNASVMVSWINAGDADGYRVLRNYNSGGYGEYQDQSGSFQDNSSGWVAGNTVTPTYLTVTTEINKDTGYGLYTNGKIESTYQGEFASLKLGSSSGWVSASTGILSVSTSALSVTYGGTGQNLSAIPQGSTLYFSGTGTIAALAKNTTATRYLSNTGTDNNPAWAQIALGTGVSGTLAVGNGGTGATTLTGVLKGNGTSAIGVMTGTANYLTKWTDANTIGNSQFRDDGTNTAIGAAPGTYKFQVAGAVLFANNSSSIDTVLITNDGGAAEYTAFKITTQGNDILKVTCDRKVTIYNLALTTPLPATSGGRIGWTEVTGTTQAIAVNSGYIANNGSLVTLTLPATAAVGDIIEVVGKGAGLWKIAQNASQVIKFGVATTSTGTGGYLSAVKQYDCVKLLCITTNTTFVVTSSVGNITYA